MAYYDALIAAWNGSPSPPVGVTGLTLVGQTTAVKTTRINAWTVPAAKPAILDVSKIINAIVPADFTALTSVQLQDMTLLLGGSGVVDASPGTTIRAVFQAIFVGKTTTLANLTALVSPFDSATASWWSANGYSSPIGPSDLAAAGGLT